MTRKKKILLTDNLDEPRRLKDLVSIGPAALADFERLGIKDVSELQNKNARVLYDELCAQSGVRHCGICFPVRHRASEESKT